MSLVRAASTRLSSRTDTKGAFALALLLGVSACHATPRPAVAPSPRAAGGVSQLQRDIEAILAAPALTRSYWGIVVRSAKDNDTLYSLNAGKLLMPGSTMKIVTLAAAAERLGWDYVYDTRLVAAGSIDAGVLDGDLLVVGSGDPEHRGRRRGGGGHLRGLGRDAESRRRADDYRPHRRRRQRVRRRGARAGLGVGRSPGPGRHRRQRAAVQRERRSGDDRAGRGCRRAGDRDARRRPEATSISTTS